MKDDKLALRNRFPIGIVTQLFPSKYDDKIRSVKIRLPACEKYKSKEITRDRNSISLLEICDDDA